MTTCALAQELPDKPKVMTKGFVLSETVQYAGVIADGLNSSQAINHGPCIEANPLFQTRAKKFETGKYFAVNLPLAGVITFGHTLVFHSTTNKTARWIMNLLVTANGANHLREVGPCR